MTIKGFTRLITILEGSFSWRMDENVRESWWEFFERVEDEEGIAAAQRCATQPSRYFRNGRPTVGDVLDHLWRIRDEKLKAARGSLDRSKEPVVTPAEARNFVREIARRCGFKNVVAEWPKEEK